MSSPNSAPVANQKNPDLCAVCFSAPADFTVIPCGHQCGCEPCLKKIQKDSHHCPICRGPINSILRIIPSGADGGNGNGNDDSNKAKAKDKPKADEKKGPVPPAVHVEVKDGLQLPEADIQVMPSAPDGDATVLVRVNVPEAPDIRAPVDVCCVIDISGSMGTEATRQEADDPNVRHSDGLNYLDVVKHAVKAVVRMLGPADRLSLVAFDQAAETVLKLTHMDDNGQQQALQATEVLQPRGNTNLWAGLLYGMESLRAGSEESRKKTILLLTDGQPNVLPPKGHVAELKQYWDKHPGFACQIHTFGFGYNLDSTLLLQLAKEGAGLYAFIPDAPIVGTVFVHTIANVLSTHTQRATLHLTAANGAEFIGPVQGDYVVTDAPWGRVVNLGPLQFGQQRELVVRMKLPQDRSKPFLETSLEYGLGMRASLEAKEREIDGSSLLIERAALRAAAVDMGNILVSKSEQESHQALNKVMADIKASPAVADESVAALQGDLAGRVMKAIDGRDRFNRWGKHYLKALFRAHHLQQCTNFMDKGVQVYGGALFAHLRALGDYAFLTLPPPKPARPLCPMCHSAFDADALESHVRQCMAGKLGVGGNANNNNNKNNNNNNNNNNAAAIAAAAAAAAPAPVNMNNYYDASGGCFGANSVVMVVQEDGSQVPTLVSQVQPGDLVHVATAITTTTGASEAARVRCVVVNVRRAHSRPLISLPGGLLITPGHPVRINGIWQRPDSIGKPSQDAVLSASRAQLVYNFVLEKNHVLLVNGIECVTLGHGLDEDGVAHAYWGSDVVLHDLAALPGWDQGRVVVTHVWRDGQRHIVALWAAAPALFTKSSDSSSRAHFAGIVSSSPHVLPADPSVFA